jgi:hypothetical protein
MLSTIQFIMFYINITLNTYRFKLFCMGVKLGFSICRPKERKWIEVVREKGAEENIWV